MDPVHATDRPIGLVRASIFVLALLAVAGCATTVAAGAATQKAPAAGMVVTDAQAVPIPGLPNAVIVTTTITNRSGRDDKLLGGSSPVATAVGLYATCSRMPPEPTDPITGIAGLAQVPWLLTRADETVQHIAGDGEMVLSGLSETLTAG
jgi:copper(I)-binding protein